MSTDQEEEKLVEQARHNPQAFAQLYNTYVERIFAYTYRLVRDEALAQDLTAVTFEKAYRNLNRFEWRGFSFCAWLYRIAHNEVMTYQRRNRIFSPLTALEKWWRSDQNVESEVQNNLQQDGLHTALERLDQADRDVLILRFYENLSSREIGEVLGYSEGNINVRLHRALKKLRAELTRMNILDGIEHV